MLRIPLLTCAVLALASTASAQSVSSEQISRILTRGLREQNLVRILRDLPALGDRFTVRGATVREAFDRAKVTEPFVAALFGDVDRIEINGDRVTFRLRSEQHLGMQAPGASKPDGWLHLSRTIQLRVSSDGGKIDKLKGVKASRSRNGITVSAYKIEFSPRSITVSAGKFGIAALKRTYPIRLGGMSSALTP